MTVQELVNKELFRMVNLGDEPEREITKPFCCDLLSIAMGKAPAGCAWVTVMGNMNTLAVASLTEAACVILVNDVALEGLDRFKGKKVLKMGVSDLIKKSDAVMKKIQDTFQ